MDTARIEVRSRHLLIRYDIVPQPIMDNLCHTLTGAAFGEAGLKRRTRFGSLTLMLAANLPDIDVLVFATDTPSVAFRRGWTHGPLAQLLLPVALTGVMLAASRLSRGRQGSPPARPAWLLVLGYVGVMSHVALDLLNSYGLRLLAPFDWRWFYGDTLFIIDPWLWGMLGGAIWLARTRADSRPARWGLAAAALYITLMVVGARAARAVVLTAWEALHGRAPRAVMVAPLPVTPFTRHVVIDVGAHYETGVFEWLPPRVTFDEATVRKNDDDPRIAQARESDGRIRGFLVWSRFPFWTLEPVTEGTRVTVGDMRFAGRTPVRFLATTVVRDPPEHQHRR
jgi:inner membrane protein